MTKRESWRKSRLREEDVLFDLKYKSLRCSGDMQMEMFSLQKVEVTTNVQSKRKQEFENSTHLLGEIRMA